MRHASLFLVALLGTACSFIDDFGRFTFDETGDAGPRDGGSALDAGAMDAGARDAGGIDAGGRDAGPLDANALDATPPSCDAESTFYRDDDGDGVGSEEMIRACTRPSGYVEETGDCDDDHDDTYPGATELCDGRDQDCDTAIDEGVLGISAPIELIPAPDASAPLVAVRHASGYFVVAGAWARWVDLSGVPTSPAFTYDSFVPTQVDALVITGSPPRLVVAYGMRPIYAKGYGIGATTTTLSRSLVVSAPTDPPYPLERMRLAAAGDQVAVVATYYEDNFGQARASTLNPLAWTSGPTATLEATIRLRALIPVASSPPHLLLSVIDEDGSGAVGTFRRLVVLPDVASWSASNVGDFGFARLIDLPVTAGAGGPAEEVLGFLYDDNTAGTCATAITPGEGTTAPTLGLCAPVTGSHRASAARGGVVSMISGDGFFTDLPLAPGTVGTPRFDMGIGTAPAALAVGADGGLVIYLSGGTLYGRVLGCGT